MCKLSDAIETLAHSICGLTNELRATSETQTILDRIETMENNIMSKLSVELDELRTQVRDGVGEVVAKIAALETAQGDRELSKEERTAMDALKADVTILSDIVPDEPATTPSVLTSEQIAALQAAGLPLTDQQVADNGNGTAPVLTVEQAAVLK